MLYFYFVKFEMWICWIWTCICIFGLFLFIFIFMLGSVGENMWPRTYVLCKPPGLQRDF